MNVISDLKTILFENNSLRQTLFKNTLWISASSFISKFLRAFLIIYIARILGPADYGRFAFALAFVSIFVSFLDLGLSPIITRELSRDPKKEKEFSSLFTLKVLLGIATISLIIITSLFITNDLEVRRIIWILAGFSFLSQLPEVLCAFIRARQKMEYEAVIQTIQVVLVVGLGFLVIFNVPSLRNISYSYLLAGAIALIPVLFIFNLKFSVLKISFKTDIWKKFLLMSWPLALTSVFGMIYSYIDSVMMGFLGQITQTGWYNASFKIINIVLVPTGILSLVFLPALSRFSRESKEKFQKIFNYQMAVMVFLAFPAVIGGAVLAEPIIDFVYDSSYFSAILSFQILIFMAGLAFINSPFSQVLVAADQQKKIFWVTFFGSVFNIIFNMILIPKFSLYGAAFATVITYLFMFFLYLFFTRKFTVIKPFNKFIFFFCLKVFLAGIIMYFVVSSSRIYSLHAVFSILSGMAVYLFVFFSLNYSFNYLFKKI